MLFLPILAVVMDLVRPRKSETGYAAKSVAVFEEYEKYIDRDSTQVVPFWDKIQESEVVLAKKISRYANDICENVLLEMSLSLAGMGEMGFDITLPIIIESWRAEPKGRKSKRPSEEHVDISWMKHTPERYQGFVETVQRGIVKSKQRAAEVYMYNNGRPQRGDYRRLVRRRMTRAQFPLTYNLLVREVFGLTCKNFCDLVQQVMDILSFETQEPQYEDYPSNKNSSYYSRVTANREYDVQEEIVKPKSYNWITQHSDDLDVEPYSDTLRTFLLCRPRLEIRKIELLRVRWFDFSLSVIEEIGEGRERFAATSLGRSGLEPACRAKAFMSAPVTARIPPQPTEATTSRKLPKSYVQGRTNYRDMMAYVNNTYSLPKSVSSAVLHVPKQHFNLFGGVRKYVQCICDSARHHLYMDLKERVHPQKITGSDFRSDVDITWMKKEPARYKSFTDAVARGRRQAQLFAERAKEAEMEMYVRDLNTEVIKVGDYRTSVRRQLTYGALTDKELRSKTQSRSDKSFGELLSKLGKGSVKSQDGLSEFSSVFYEYEDALTEVSSTDGYKDTEEKVLCESTGHRSANQNKCRYTSPG